MTIPWMMNCDHSETGWCLECVSAFGEEKRETEERERKRIASALREEAKQWEGTTMYHPEHCLKAMAEILAVVDSVAHRANLLRNDPVTEGMGQMVEITCEAIRRAVTGENDGICRDHSGEVREATGTVNQSGIEVEGVAT